MNTHLHGTSRYSPEAVSPEADVRQRLMPLEPNHRWTLLTYGEWDWDYKSKRSDGGTGRWIPTLKQIRHTPGCNGVSEANKVANISNAIAGAMGRGGLVIQPSDPRLGKFRG